MTLAQLYQLIDDNIRQNHNEEITGSIDNSVRHAVVDWVRDQVGDLSQLNTNNTSDIVTAINEVLTDIANNQSFQNEQYYAQAKVVDSPINSVSGQMEDYLIVNDSGMHYFGVKKSLDYEFEGAKLLFLSGLDKKVLTSPNVTNSNYNFWNVGSITNLPAAGDFETFDVWFHVRGLTASFTNVDGTHKGNYFRHVPLPTNSGNTVEQGDALENGWISDGAGGWSYVYLMVYDGTGDIHNSSNYTIINKV